METLMDCAVRLSGLFPSSFILNSIEEENTSNQAKVELIWVKKGSRVVKKWPLETCILCGHYEGRKEEKDTPTLSSCCLHIPLPEETHIPGGECN